MKNYVIQTYDGDCCFGSPLALCDVCYAFWFVDEILGSELNITPSLMQIYVPIPHSWCSERLIQVLGLCCKHLLKKYPTPSFQNTDSSFVVRHMFVNIIDFCGISPRFTLERLKR